MKTCSRCQIEKPIRDFGVLTRSKDGRAYSCKVCVRNMNQISDKKYRAENSLRHKRWLSENPEKKKVYSRRSNLKLNYNLTIEQFNEMSAKQNNACAICTKVKKLFVDHCHTSGNIRGLLCHQCNSGLGYFQDSLYNLTTAYRYIFAFEPRTKINRESL